MTAKTQMYIFVEGADDLRLIQHLKPILEEKYSLVQIVEYRREKREKVNSYMRAIKKMGAELVMLADLDGATCKDVRRRERFGNYPELPERGVLVVVREIEGWYVAGLSADACRKLRVPAMPNTLLVDKVVFKNCSDKKFGTPLELKLEILNHFSVGMAKSRNDSFAYFWKRVTG